MADQLLSTLDGLETALSADNYTQARPLVKEMLEVYDSHEPKERARVERAKVLSSRNLRDGRSGEVPTYLNQVQLTNLKRFGVTTGLGMLVPNPNGADADLSSFVRELRIQEEELDTTAEAVEPILESATLPASPRLFSVSTPDSVPLGTQFEILITAGNVGDSSAESVQMSITTDDQLSIESDTSFSIDLSARSNRDLSIQCVATDAGKPKVSVELDDGEDIPIAETTEVEVLDPAGYLDRAENRLERLRSMIESIENSGGWDRSLVVKIESSLDSLDRARGFFEDDRQKLGNNQLNTTTKRLGALLNAIEALKKRSQIERKNGNVNAPSTRVCVGFIEVTEQIIDLLVDAQEVEI